MRNDPDDGPFRRTAQNTAADLGRSVTQAASLVDGNEDTRVARLTKQLGGIS